MSRFFVIIWFQEKGGQLMDKASNAAQSAKESAQNVIFQNEALINFYLLL